MPGTSYAEVTTTDVYCGRLLGSATVVRDILWTNGQVSTLSYVYTAQSVDGNIVFTINGTVNAGLYAGRSVVGFSTITSIVDGDPEDWGAVCETEEGNTLMRGPISLQILP